MGKDYNDTGVYPGHYGNHRTPTLSDLSSDKNTADWHVCVCISTCQTIMRQASCKFVDIYLSAYLYAYPSKWKILTDMDVIAHPCQCEIEMHAV